MSNIVTYMRVPVKFLSLKILIFNTFKSPHLTISFIILNSILKTDDLSFLTMYTDIQLKKESPPDHFQFQKTLCMHCTQEINIKVKE